MKPVSSSRSDLLLMEMILAILFFSLISAICLQLFVKAHNMSQDTRELDAAVRQADSVASVLLQASDPMRKIGEIYPDFSVDNRCGKIYFNSDFQPCASEDSAYYLDIIPTKTDPQSTSYSVTVYDDTSAEIYHIDVAAYQQYIP